MLFQTIIHDEWVEKEIFFNDEELLEAANVAAMELEELPMDNNILTDEENSEDDEERTATKLEKKLPYRLKKMMKQLLLTLHWLLK